MCVQAMKDSVVMMSSCFSDSVTKNDSAAMMMLEKPTRMDKMVKARVACTEVQEPPEVTLMAEVFVKNWPKCMLSSSAHRDEVSTHRSQGSV